MGFQDYLEFCIFYSESDLGKGKCDRTANLLINTRYPSVKVEEVRGIHVFSCGPKCCFIGKQTFKIYNDDLFM